MADNSFLLARYALYAVPDSPRSLREPGWRSFTARRVAEMQAHLPGRDAATPWLFFPYFPV